MSAPSGRKWAIGLQKNSHGYAVKPYIKRGIAVVIDPGTFETSFRIEGGPITTIPSVLRINKDQEVDAFGHEAFQSWGKTPKGMETIFPIENGSIKEPRFVVEMLQKMFAVAAKESGINKWYPANLTILATLHTNPTGSDSDLLVNALKRAFPEAALYTADQSVLGAIGCNQSILSPDGCMVVDIGGGTIDGSVLVLGKHADNGAKSDICAGFAMNRLIVDYVRRKKYLRISMARAEDIKRKLGTALAYNGNEYLLETYFPTDEELAAATPTSEAMIVQAPGAPQANLQTVSVPKSLKGKPLQLTVKGKGIKKRGEENPNTCDLTRAEISEAINEVVEQQVRFINELSSGVGEGLCDMVIENGAYICGGGAYLPGLQERISHDIKLITAIPEGKPEECVIQGAWEALTSPELFKHVAVQV